MGTRYHIDYGLQKRHKPGLYAVVIIILFSVVTVGLYFLNSEETGNINRPAASVIQAEQPSQIIDTPMPWPAYGHAAYTIKEKEKVATSGSNPDIVPIASLAKVITALAVLEKQPLEPGEDGPIITITEEDAALYDKYLQKNGAVLPAEAGQQLSQHDALQAMLMVSANNISDILVRWAFGSVDEYTEYANNMVKELGLSKTTVADANGFSPHTASTAEEMTRLGILYMENPILKDIAYQKKADVPIFGTIQNYNYLADRYDILGIKVGDTDEAGRCFMAADVNGDSVSVAVVLGAEDLTAAIKDAQKIITAGNSGYGQNAENNNQ